MDAPFEIREYTADGRSPFAEWFDDLDSVTAARVDRYIRRLECGNFGAAKVVGEGVSELRLEFWAGLPRVFRTGRKDADYPAGRREQAATGRGHRCRDCALEALPAGEERKMIWL
jgi:putative addiction module killer protein